MHALLAHPVPDDVVVVELRHVDVDVVAVDAGDNDVDVVVEAGDVGDSLERGLFHC